MRYILDDLGYIEEISFGGYIECNNKTCTEYTGEVPEGYDSLIDWVEKANIRAYYLLDGNLTYDADKDAELQVLYSEELMREVKITSTKTPPDASGNWELIDQELSYDSDTTGFTKSNLSSANFVWVRNGHNLYCRLTFVNSVTLNDTAVTIGKIDCATLGVLDLTYDKYPIGYTDGGGAVLMITIDNKGDVIVEDVIDKGGSNVVSSGASCRVDFTCVIAPENMLESACNKFYWRRKA